MIRVMKVFPLSTDGKLANRPEVDLWGYPALIEPRDSVFVLITEANIRRGHCGSFLYNGDNRDNYQVRLGDKNLLLAVCGNLHGDCLLLVL